MDAATAYIRFRDGAPQASRLPESLAAASRLSGGLSGAEVFLVYPEERAPLVLKVDQESVIDAEAAAREQRGYDTTPLEAMDASHVADGGLGAAGVPLKIIAYSYFGPIKSRELKYFSDFEDLTQERISSGSFGEEQLGFVLEAVADKLAGQPQRWKGTPLPAREAIPQPKWESLAPILGALEQSSLDDLGVHGLRDWWESQVDGIGIDPFPDRRMLHGDPRFANVLVNRATSQVELIDFGGGRRGHVFHDLARFELDLWLRSTPWSAAVHKRDDDLRERAALALGIETSRTDLTVRIAAHWRESIRHALPSLREPLVEKMYRLFVLAEVLRRLAWVAPDSERNVGGSTRQLLWVIRVLRGFIDGTADPTAPLETLSESTQQTLGITRFFIPTAETNFAVNETRNQAKRAALAMAAQAGGTVDLIAETGNSYLHVRGPFFSTLRDLLARGGTIRVVVLAATTDTGNPHRGRKFEESVEGAMTLYSQFPGQIELRTTSHPLTASVLLTEGVCFYEPYFNTDRRRRERLLFDTFELEIDANGGHLAALLVEHFARLATESSVYPLDRAEA